MEKEDRIRVPSTATFLACLMFDVSEEGEVFHENLITEPKEISNIPRGEGRWGGGNT